MREDFGNCWVGGVKDRMPYVITLFRLSFAVDVHRLAIWSDSAKIDTTVNIICV